MYRLHIDIPLPFDEETAKQIGLSVISALLLDHSDSHAEKVILSLDPITETSTLEPESQSYKYKQLNYRLGHDEDRQRSNYYVKDSKGHVTHKKCIVDFSEDGVPQPRTDYLSRKE